MASEKLRQFSERINLMSLRERALVFGAAVVVGLALVQVLLIDVVEQRRQGASARLQNAESMLAQIEAQRTLLAGRAGQDPDRTVREALAAQMTRLDQLNAELELRERSLIPPERMHQLLKEMVRQQDGVRIVAVKALSPQPVALPDAAPTAPPGFYRHGFEIVVGGGYAELVAYLERLEALPWRLNWIEATLDTAARPDLQLTLIVHTLSLEEAWLRV